MAIKQKAYYLSVVIIPLMIVAFSGSYFGFPVLKTSNSIITNDYNNVPNLISNSINTSEGCRSNEKEEKECLQIAQSISENYGYSLEEMEKLNWNSGPDIGANSEDNLKTEGGDIPIGWRILLFEAKTAQVNGRDVYEIWINPYYKSTPDGQKLHKALISYEEEKIRPHLGLFKSSANLYKDQLEYSNRQANNFIVQILVMVVTCLILAVNIRNMIRHKLSSLLLVVSFLLAIIAFIGCILLSIGRTYDFLGQTEVTEKILRRYVSNAYYDFKSLVPPDKPHPSYVLIVKEQELE